MSKKTILPFLAVALCVAGVAASFADEAPVGTKRPKILQIFREHVKPGRSPAHEKNEAGWPAALRKAGSKGHYLAMTSSNEAWFLTPHQSYAAMEAQGKAEEANAALSAEVDRLWGQDGDLLSAAGSMIAEYREDLSYRPDWDVARMRYYTVTVFRLNPGYGRDFKQMRKLVNDAHDKAKMDERWSVYEVVAGAPDGTYIYFQPHASLAEWDKLEEMHGKPFEEALGEDARIRLRSFSREAVKSSETHLFRFSPTMSYVPKEFVDRDAEFWAPKPAPAKK